MQLTSNSVQKTIKVESAGSLENALTAEQQNIDTELAIVGVLSDEDIAFLGKFTRKKNSLRNIDLKGVNGLTSIDHNAFEMCSNLEQIVLPECIRRIGDHAFDSCKRLRSMQLPDDVEIIGDRAFSGCENLVHINVPSTVSYIGVGCFFGCYKLTELEVDTNNARYHNQENILVDIVDKTLIKYLPKKTLESHIETPAGIIHIGNYAFDGCYGLTSVSVNEGCTDLGERSFVSCKDLKEISLPSSLNNITYNAFENCDKLEVLSVKDNNPNYSSVGGVLYSKDKKKLIICPKSKKSPFFFPDTVEEINEGAFAGCSRINTIILPHSIRKINEYAFNGCAALRFISIPKNLEEIGSFSFAGCTNLKQINVYSDVPPHCGVCSFDSNISQTCRIEVPYDTEMNYRAEYGWDIFKNVKETLSLTLGTNFPPLRNLVIFFKRIYIYMSQKTSKPV